MFSVIIPLYNKEKYIVTAIQSVLNQDFNRFELIVIDDGSTDNSLQIAQTINDPRLKIISQENKGVSAARNRGILEAKYDWIGFLDADDRWDKTFLSEVWNAMNRHKNNVIFATKIIIMGDKVESKPQIIPNGKISDEISLYKILGTFNFTPICPSNSVIKKDNLIKAGLFIEGQANFEDYCLWLRLCIKEKIVFINKELSFGSDDDPASASKKILKSKDFITIIETIESVKNRLSMDDLFYFKEYYNRFLLFLFIMYREHYTKNEIITIRKKLNQLLNKTRIPVIYFFSIFKIKFKYLYKAKKMIDRIIK